MESVSTTITRESALTARAGTPRRSDASPGDGVPVRLTPRHRPVALPWRDANDGTTTDRCPTLCESRPSTCAPGRDDRRRAPGGRFDNRCRAECPGRCSTDPDRLDPELPGRLQRKRPERQLEDRP